MWMSLVEVTFGLVLAEISFGFVGWRFLTSSLLAMPLKWFNVHDWLTDWLADPWMHSIVSRNAFRSAWNCAAACNLLLMSLLLGQISLLIVSLDEAKITCELHIFFFGFRLPFVLIPTLTFMRMLIRWKRVGFCNGTVGESESNIN